MKNQKNKLKQRIQRKDYMKKKNIVKNNLPKEESFKRVLSAGDGLLPKSRKIIKAKKK